MAVAVNAFGDAVVVGYTSSPDFPVVSALQPVFAGGFDDAFMVKISSGGGINWATYLGGSDFDEGHAIAVDIAGNAYVTGSTLSPDFPTPNPMPPDSTRVAPAFVVKLNAKGSTLIYPALLNYGADVTAIAVDAQRVACGKSAKFTRRMP